MRESHSEVLFSKNSLLNSLLAGNLRVETGSIRAASTTTQSCATGDFLKVYERPRIGGDLCDGSFSETASLRAAGRFCAFFSGPEIPFPGNGDRERQRLGSNAGYGAHCPWPQAMGAAWNYLPNELRCCCSIPLGDQHGYRHREMVQSNEGLWVHSAARRRQRCVRTHQCRRTCRTDVTQRRTNRSIRD